MALYKIKDFFPDYQEEFSGIDILKYSVYAGTSEAKIGFVRDILVDEEGHFRYFVVETGFWIFGKKVLLPMGQALIDSDNNCIYALAIKGIKQAEKLPEYHDDLVVDFNYEENVLAHYRDSDAASTQYDRDSYNYHNEPELFQIQEKDSAKTIELYEERLIANKKRQKSGEVSIGKKIETDVASVSVPVEKEKVIIERHDSEEVVAPGSVEFGSEVARVDVYEETANIEKQAVVREEISIHKEVDRDRVEATETLRKEELEIHADNQGVIEQE